MWVYLLGWAWGVLCAVAVLAFVPGASGALVVLALCLMVAFGLALYQTAVRR